MNTTENNKSIAEFMQLDKIVKTNGVVFRDNNTKEIHLLKYHSDWNWLMMAIEKIESLGFEVLIGRISCQINEILNRENPISSFVCGDISKKIEIVYSAVLQFIKWYNQQKQYQ